MFAKIVEFSNLEWKEAVKPAKFDKNTERTIVARTESAADDELRLLWARKHGLCTSWAVLVTDKLEESFIFADAGGHRGALSTNATFIDSSTRIAIKLEHQVPLQGGNFTYTLIQATQPSPSLLYLVCYMFLP